MSKWQNIHFWLDNPLKQAVQIKLTAGLENQIYQNNTFFKKKKLSYIVFEICVSQTAIETEIIFNRCR